MPSQARYTVPDMACEHCEARLRGALQALPGVQSVSVDLQQKQIILSGDDLQDAAIRDAIEAAGYEAA